MPDEVRRIEEEIIIERSEYLSERGGRRLLSALIAIAAVLGFAVVLVYAYWLGQEDGSAAAPLIIKAHKGPEKIRPETPGGMKVPDRDKEVFSRLDSREQHDRVERLLPPPDKPLDRPAPHAVQLTGTAAGISEKMPEKVVAEAPRMTETLASKMAVMPEQSLKTVPAPKAVEPDKNVMTPSQKPAATAQTAVAALKPEPTKKLSSAPAAVPTTLRWRVQLASLNSRAAAEQNWKTIQQTNMDVLGKLSLNVQTVTLSGGRGTYYRLQAGPFASRNAASAACTRLKARNQGCLVVQP